MAYMDYGTFVGFNEKEEKIKKIPKQQLYNVKVYITTKETDSYYNVTAIKTTTKENLALLTIETVDGSKYVYNWAHVVCFSKTPIVEE